MELESAIQELISRLEFVSLPGLGSFVKKYEPATPTANGFNPPMEYYTFDTSRTFNDEALENFICTTSNVDHKKASALVSESVDNIKAKLANGEHVSFYGVGVLKQNALGVIELVPFEDSFSKTFGLGKVEATKKGATTSKVEPISTKTNVIEPTKSVEPDKSEQSKSKQGILLPIALIFIGIAIVALVLFVPALRFWEGNSSATSEEIAINNEIPVEENSTVDTTLTHETNDSVETNVIVTPTFNTESSKATVTDKKVALYYQETKLENKSYYIIVGSFSQENNAQKLIQDLSVKGYKPILLQSDNMFRVAVYKFTNRDRALRELERLKEQKLSDKVWLLSQ